VSQQILLNQPMDRPPGRRYVRRVIAAVVVSVLAGGAILLQIRGWSALATEAGGACGGFYGACPPGETPVMIISLIIGIGTVPVVFAMLFRRPRKAIISLIVVVGLVAGGFLGQDLFDTLHGRTIPVSWSAQYDPANNVATQGVWTTGDSVVRIRTDNVVSYDSATGATRWTFGIPGQDVVCAISRTPAGQVGMLGYGPQNTPCDHLVALDLTTGRQLWSTDVAVDGQEQPPIVDFVAAGGNLAVTRTADEVIALDATTGTRRWTSNAADGCREQFVAADPTSVVAIATCDNEYVVADLDPATGSLRWQTRVPESTSGYQLALLSVTPVVVSDILPGQRTVDNVRVFTAQGRQNVTIPVASINSSDGPVDLNTAPLGGKGFGPQPVWWTVVADGRLVGLTHDINGHEDAIAFSVTTGQQEWLRKLPDDAEAVALNGNELTVVDESAPVFEVDSIALGNGASSEIGVIDSADFGDDNIGLYPAGGGRYVAVNEIGANPVPPVFAFK
jgi:hypothetical protein